MSLAIDPGDFENPHGVTAWSPDGGTLAQSNTVAHAGTFSAALTVTGSPAQAYIRAYGASAVPVVAGTLYETTMWVRSPSALDVLPAIDWFDASSVYIGGEYPAQQTLAVDTWTELQVTGLAPPGAAFAVYGPSAVSPTAGQILYADDVDFDYPAGAFTVTATEQDSFPPRVQIAVTGMTIGDSLEIFRQVAGELTAVRAGADDAVSDPAFIVIDAEIPFGVPVNYVAFVNGVGESTPQVTYTLPGGKVALTDAITGAAAEVIITAAGDRVYARDSARFRVAGRNLVVTGPVGQAEGSYELLTTTTTARNSLIALLSSATEGVVQIRQAGLSAASGDPYDGIDAYLAVDRFTERRFSQDGSDPRRLTTIDFAEVAGWAAELEARGFTLQDLSDYFGPTGTLQDVDDFPGPGGTLLDLALADWTP